MAPTKAAPPSIKRPPLAAFAKAPDPINEREYPGTVQGDADTEASQLQTGFRERMAQEAGRFKTATEGDYYSCVIFETGEQCRAFLAALGKDGGMFIDGRVLADRLGIRLPKAEVKFNPGKKPDPKLASLVRKSPVAAK